MIELLGQAEPITAPTASASTCRIRVRMPSGEENIGPLAGLTVSIGRSDANDIHAEDPELSRFHAQLLFEDGAWVLCDLSSKNGTAVNGRACDRHVLKHGDRIETGDTLLVFEAVDDAAARPTTTIKADSSERLDPLVSFGDLLACAEEELGALDAVVARIRDVISCERATIVLVEESSSKPLMQFSIQDTVTGNAPDVSEPVLQRALESEQPTMETLPGPIPHHLLMAPLHSRYRKLGVIVLERGMHAHPFDAADLQITSIIAAHVTSFLRGVI